MVFMAGSLLLGSQGSRDDILALATILLRGAVAFANMPALQVCVVKQAERYVLQAVDVAPAPGASPAHSSL
ncbi:MAG TPA: hypothetical protein VLA16_24910 [Ideonella sp.]|nr:hypothetical protein [Ideonella sp.]